MPVNSECLASVNVRASLDFVYNTICALAKKVDFEVGNVRMCLVIGVFVGLGLTCGGWTW